MLMKEKNRKERKKEKINVLIWKKEKVDLSGQPPHLPQPVSNPHRLTCWRFWRRHGLWLTLELDLDS